MEKGDKVFESQGRMLFDVGISTAACGMIDSGLAMMENSKPGEQRYLNIRIFTGMIKHLNILLHLLKAQDKHGLPKELIFIDEVGNKIDLIGNKSLDENELINAFLDNVIKTEKQ